MPRLRRRVEHRRQLPDEPAELRRQCPDPKQSNLAPVRLWPSTAKHKRRTRAEPLQNTCNILFYNIYILHYFATYCNTTSCKVAKWRWTSSLYLARRSRHGMKYWPCRKPGSAADLRALSHSPLSKTSAGRSFEVWQFGTDCRLF